MTDKEEIALARKGRMVGLVIAGTNVALDRGAMACAAVRLARTLCAAVRLCRAGSPDLGDGQYISDEAGPRGQP